MGFHAEKEPITTFFTAVKNGFVFFCCDDVRPVLRGRGCAHYNWTPKFNCEHIPLISKIEYLINLFGEYMVLDESWEIEYLVSFQYRSFIRKIKKYETILYPSANNLKDEHN